MIGRGGESFPKTQFNYYHIIPKSSAREENFTIYALKDTLISEIIYQKEPIFRDIPTSYSSRKDGFSLYLKERDIASYIAIPLIVKHKALGVLYAGFRDRSARTIATQKLLQNIADELARAIEGLYLLYDLRISLEELKRAHQELKGLDNLKSEFISSVSHELRTPLVSMTGYLHMILDGKLGPITDLQKEGLEVSVKSLERLTNLIKKMLTFSSEQKEAKLEFGRFAVDTVIGHCVKALKSVATDQGVRIEESIEKSLPDVYADEDKIIQVLINLMDNAIKFSPEGKTVQVIARKDPRDRSDRIEVLVRDRGQGISRKDQEKIFEKFWQAPKEAGKKRKGIGLGLALVKKIIDQHQCRIRVESTVGKGTTFFFTLPVYSKTQPGSNNDSNPDLGPDQSKEA